jgi:hypothetical protein
MALETSIILRGGRKRERPLVAGNFPGCEVDQFQTAEWISFTPP